MIKTHCLLELADQRINRGYSTQRKRGGDIKVCDALAGLRHRVKYCLLGSNLSTMGLMYPRTAMNVPTTEIINLFEIF